MWKPQTQHSTPNVSILIVTNVQLVYRFRRFHTPVQITKFKFRQYQITAILGPFAKFNAHQIFLLYGILSFHCPISSVDYTFSLLDRVNILLVGSGDLRHVLMTLAHATTQHPSKSVHVSCFNQHDNRGKPTLNSLKVVVCTVKMITV